MRKNKALLRDLGQEAQYRRAVLSESILVYAINLTQNFIEGEIYAAVDGKSEPMLEQAGLPAPCPFDLFVKTWSKAFVQPESRTAFESNLNREFLLDCWDRGQLAVKFELNTYFHGEYQTLRQNIFLVQDMLSGDIIAQTNIKDITNERQKELQLHRHEQLFVAATSDLCVKLLQIDLDSLDTQRVYAGSGEFSRESLGNWNDYLPKLCTSVHSSDVPAILRLCSSEALRAMQIGQKEVVNFRSASEESDGSWKYYSTNICISEACSQRFATLFTLDNTLSVESERRQKKLIEDALAQAEAASKAKTVFLSNMSHDIRTPMNAILGFASLASTHLDNPAQVQSYLSKILSSGNHLLELINDILDMSRIESGRIQLNKTECSLSEILHELRNIVQADIKTRGLDFYIDTMDVLDENVRCDRLRLNQILLNLLGNAIKFTPSGGSVSVRITQHPGPTHEVGDYEICVKDTGIGMSEEFVSRIFEPFEREQSAIASGIQGTGLGMSITKNIIDMMDGTIEVHSQKGKGSEFIVHLPLEKLAAAPVYRTIDELQGTRALVVDDDFHCCDSTTHMLTQIGMRVEWTLSGSEALLRAEQAVRREDPYRVYIIDWQMPEMNGVELVRRLRRDIGEQTPIIVLTAYDWTDIEVEAREAGVTAFCGKPLFLSDLTHCLQQALHSEPVVASTVTVESNTPSAHLLLAEDNELNREIACELLEDAGFTVETAENGAIAIEMLEASPAHYYDLILMDIQMPILNGYEACRRIRELSDPEKASIPVLAMTANAFDEDRQRALDAGMNGHLSKPIQIDTVCDAIRQHIRK
jgi:signal transduction histidine kinase/DNA-binding response OmpR family regulator